MPTASLTHFRIYARAALLDRSGRILLIKKSSDQKIGAGRWLLPGGAVEFGETAEEAVRRELREEINFEVTDENLLGVRTILLEKTHWQGIYFQVLGDLSTIKNLEPQKHSELAWFPLHELPAGFDDLDGIESQIKTQP